MAKLSVVLIYKFRQVPQTIVFESFSMDEEICKIKLFVIELSLCANTPLHYTYLIQSH